MFDWLLNIYLNVLFNKEVLFNNPTGSEVVTVLKLVSLAMLIYNLGKFIIHYLFYKDLIKNHIQITGNLYPNFRNLVADLSKKVGLSEIPNLYLFADNKPLVFTIGTLKPAIFISPTLINRLNIDEMSAVLAHELSHIMNSDNLFIKFVKFLKTLIPVSVIMVFGYHITMDTQSPLFWYLLTFIVILSYKLFYQERAIYKRELDCDDNTVNILKDPLLLASSIIKVWKTGKHLPMYNWRMSIASVRPFADSSMSNDSRIKRLINYKKSMFGKVIRTIINLGLVTIFSLVIFFAWEMNASNTYAGVSVVNGKIMTMFSIQSDSNRMAMISINSKSSDVILKKFIGSTLHDSKPSFKFSNKILIEKK